MNSERKLFGTDGVRDLANSGKMTPEIALKLGRSFIRFNHGRKIVVGLDTRLSGRMLEGALSSGISSEGADVYLAGIIPTPGVSYAIKSTRADGGAVISASHNPAEYNGIKFLGADGCKLSDDEELEIENILEKDERNTSHDNIGKIHDCPELVKDYAKHIASLLEPEAAVDRVAFDCANGASAMSVPVLVKSTKFSALNTHVISRDYDGLNINKDCGVMHMANLTSFVKKNNLALGFAFDGDADRVLISDSKGRIIDGDIILWVLGRWLKRSVKNEKVVVTVMSNMALESHFADEGIETLRCPVGDRYVLETMRDSGAGLGGEQSGHIIASKFTSTGDGLCTAMLFLNAVHELGEDVSTLVDRFGRYPQCLTNLTLKRPRENVDMTAINVIVSEYQEKVSRSKGRIFIRTSGTEPLLRILVEAPESGTVEELSSVLSSRLEEFC